MTEKEFKQFVAEQHRQGKSDEEILYVFALMLREDQLSKEQFIAVAEALGFEIDPKIQKLPLAQFKKAMFQ